jgi:hypothetical protein
MVPSKSLSRGSDCRCASLALRDLEVNANAAASLTRDGGHGARRLRI